MAVKSRRVLQSHRAMMPITLLVVHKVESVCFPPHFCFAVMNCNYTSFTHNHYYYSILLIVSLLPPTLFLISHHTPHTHTYSFSLSLSLFFARTSLSGFGKDKGDERDLLPIKGFSSQAMWPASTWMHHCRKLPGLWGSRHHL